MACPRMRKLSVARSDLTPRIGPIIMLECDQEKGRTASNTEYKLLRSMP